MKMIVDLMDDEDMTRAVALLQGLLTLDEEDNTPQGDMGGGNVNQIMNESDVDKPDGVMSDMETTNPTTDTGSTDVDKHGRAHDDRIDSSNLRLTDEGEWCRRRKPKEMNAQQWNDFYAGVVKELRDGGSLPGDAVTRSAGVSSVFDSPNEPDASIIKLSYNAFKERVMTRLMDDNLPNFSMTYVTEKCNELGFTNIQETEKNENAIQLLAKSLGVCT